MERYQTMIQVKELYEEILATGDGEYYLQREEEIDNLFLILQSSDKKTYSPLEIEMLQTLSELNQSMELLLTNSMNRMRKTRAMSTKLVKKYDASINTDSYFYDRKT